MLEKLNNGSIFAFLYENEDEKKQLGIISSASDDDLEFMEDEDEEKWNFVCAENYYFAGTESQTSVSV